MHIQRDGHAAKKMAAGYCRVSTKEQTKNLSLTTQEEAIRKYCEREGLRVDRVFMEEGESAKTADRPVLKEMLAYCRANKRRLATVVVYALSRLSRNTHDHTVIRAFIYSLGITLRSVTEPIDESTMGKFMESMLAAVSQLDNDMRADRAVGGMKTALEKGRWPFTAPLGYSNLRDSEGKAAIVPDPDRRSLLVKGFELMSTGQHNKLQVLRILTDLGLRTRKGKRVSPQTFDNVLRNPIYTGVMHVDKWGVVTKGSFEPLISEDLYNRVQSVLKGKSHTVTPYQRNHPDFPLRRHVKCGYCKLPLTGGPSKGRSKYYKYYNCRARDCRSKSIRKEVLEEQFTDYLERLQPEAKYMRLLKKVVLDVWKEKQSEVTKRRRALSKRIEELKERKQKLVDAFVYERAIDKITYQEQLDNLNETIAITEIEMHDVGLEKIDIESVLSFAQYVMCNAAAFWVQGSLEQKQRFQKVLFPEGVEYYDGIFKTAVTSPVFRALQQSKSEKASEVSPTGFEPVSPP